MSCFTYASKCCMTNCSHISPCSGICLTIWSSCFCLVVHTIRCRGLYYTKWQAETQLNGFGFTASGELLLLSLFILTADVLLSFVKAMRAWKEIWCEELQKIVQDWVGKCLLLCFDLPLNLFECDRINQKIYTRKQ